MQTPFRQWQSPLSLPDVFAKPATPAYPQLCDGRIYWMETLASEQGRTVVKCLHDGEVSSVTPDDVSVRTRVNEYGGKAYLATHNALYFCDAKDQCLYRISLVGGKPERLTQNHPRRYYADLTMSPDGQWLFFVMETERDDENLTQIAYIPTQAKEPLEPQVLVSGADFYSDLALAADGQRLAWVQWHHPNLPWDETVCCVASLSEHNEVLQADVKTMLEGDGINVSQTVFLDDNTLLLTADWPQLVGSDMDKARDYANIYRYDLITETLTAVTSGQLEYSYPHWVFGLQRIAALDARRILAIATGAEGDQLHCIDIESGHTEHWAQQYSDFSCLCSDAGNSLVLAGAPDQPTKLISVNADGRTKAVATSVQTNGDELPLLAKQDISQAISLRIGEGRQQSHAYYYAPANSRYQANDALPPLLVMVHGGPTARCNSSFDIMKQFWTTSGFAILDVNHRGSTGYGRRYRDALLEQWGEVDMQDIVAAIEHVISADLAHPDQVFIRGKSAGGYAVQRVLTQFPHLFAAGASYYGIGDLATLAATTHKFEKYYCDRLLGETYDPATARSPQSVYVTRSPLHDMDKLQCPLIVFQGSDDKVVPPQLAEQVVSALRERGIAHEYHVYAGEGHGFRSLDTLVHSLQSELSFYRQQMQSS